jgi:DHA2 family multidrug resistance protein-like MFS transporter
MLVAGALLVGGGLVLMATMVATSSYWSIVPGASPPPSTTLRARSVGALGIALMGSIFNARYRSGISDVAATLDPAQGRLVRDGIAGASEVARGMGADGAPVLDAARQALVDAWAGSMWIGAAIAAVR